MRIAVYREDGTNIRLRLPDGLVLNRLSACMISEMLKRKSINVSGKQLYTAFRTIQRYRLLYPEWKLIEVHKNNGESVEIVL